MASNNTILNQDFPIAKDNYLAFDALTLKQLIKNRLNAGGVFTDQNYEGSYISTIIDSLAWFYNSLLYYLNRTSTESMFTDAQVYENINRIVKLLDYNPIGNQTATLSFSMSADATLPIGIYTIPRYSYVSVNGYSYSFSDDVPFRKTTNNAEYIEDVSTQKLLYQGKFMEYPVYTAKGEENEVVFLIPGETEVIDHFNIQVYVQHDGVWSKWGPTPSLYLEISTAEKYEIRFNDQEHYEMKFGNGINGKKLEVNDSVAIYYLKSDGKEAEVGANAVQDSTLIQFYSTQYEQILSAVAAQDTTYLTPVQAGLLSFDNTVGSSLFGEAETVDEIRQNAPGVFRSQYRLVTVSDYETFVKTNFANLIRDVKVVANWTYLSEYLKYLHDIGLSQPGVDARVMFNQVMFGDSCNFNNIYVYVVPRMIDDVSYTSLYLTPAMKEMIITSMQDQKTATAEVILLDPVFMAISLGVPKAGTEVSTADADVGELYIVKDEYSRRDSNSIIEEVANVFVNYFSQTNSYLGQTVDVSGLTKSILAVPGVKTFYTRRSDDVTVRVDGLGLIVWNPVYPANDVSYVVENLVLESFKYPFLYNKSALVNKIVVEDTSKTFEAVEY